MLERKGQISFFFPSEDAEKEVVDGLPGTGQGGEQDGIDRELRCLVIHPCALTGYKVLFLCSNRI